MRIQKVVCDRCGEEIQADPYQICCEQIDLGTGDFTAEETFPQIQGRDFCAVCAKQIVDFIMAEGVIGVIEEPLGKAAGKASKGTKSKIDGGKATALKNAGLVPKPQYQADTGDIVIPIYLGNELIDEIIITAQDRRNLRTGGR